MAAVRSLSVVGLAWLLLLGLPTWSWAHGFAGQRFFPTTLAIDDPFVSDELSFLLRHIKQPGQGETSPTLSTKIAAEYTKRLTPRLGLSLGGSFVHLKPDEGSTENGFSNLEVGAKYQLITSASSEALLSLGLTAEVGGTGSRSVGADSFSTLSPSLFFGKGFGDLPETEPRFATFTAKWDDAYRAKWGIRNGPAAPLPPATEKKLPALARRVYALLKIKGMGRVDFRLTPAGELAFIEANPNPFLAQDEDFAQSAARAGSAYPRLIDRILRLGLAALRE